MSDKKGKPASGDAFSDMSLAGMGKYNARNAEAHRLKRAAELDDRIREFAGRKRDDAWMEEAPGFCERETLANKDIFDLSKEAYRLPLMVEEANKLRTIAKKEEADREAARLAKIEADGAARVAKMEADAKAKAAADRIAAEAKAAKDAEEAAARIAKAKADAETARLIREREEQEAKLKAERDARAEADRLRRIQAEADEQALRAKLEAERLAEEKRLAAEAHKADVQSKAEAGDSLVSMLEGSPRSKYWCDEVIRASEEINAYPREARILMKKLPVLEELLEEAKELREAIILDKRIEKLSETAVSKRSASWAEDVLACEADCARVSMSKLREADTLTKLVPIARRVKFDKDIKVYEQMLVKLSAMSETGVDESTCHEYDELMDKVLSLGFDLEEFIPDFHKKWKDAGMKVSASNKKRAEDLRALDREKHAAALAAAERRKKAEEEEARRKEEERRRGIVEEYRFILEVIESADFDSQIDRFLDLYADRKSHGFAISSYLQDFEKRMTAAHRAVEKRQGELAAERKQREAAAAAAKEKAAKEAAAEIHRLERIEAMKKHRVLIISLAAVILASVALVVLGVVFRELQNILDPLAMFILATYFVSFYGPVVRRRLYSPALTITLKSLLAVGGFVLTCIPGMAPWGLSLFATLVLGGGLELVLILVLNPDSDYDDDPVMLGSLIVSMGIGLILSFISLGVIFANPPLAVLGACGAFVALTVVLLIMGLRESDLNWILIGATIALGVAGFVLCFINRFCVQTGIILAATAAVNLIVISIISHITDYDESHYATGWSCAAVAILICCFALLMSFKFWGREDFVVSEDGVLQGVFVHDGSTELRIPAEYKGIEITTIGFDALDRISLKNGWRCSFKTIYLPETVKVIEPHAFSWCNMPTVVLNEGLEVIADNAFYSAYTTHLGYPEGYVKSEGDPDNYIPSTVKEIGNNAFWFAGIQGSIKLPDSCTKVGGLAFAGTDITEADISSATVLGSSIFTSTLLQSVKVNDSLTALPTGMFRETDIKTVTLPSGLTEIPQDCFYNCEYLTDVEIPDSVTKIGQAAFAGCKKLHELDATGVTDIGTDCFKNTGSGKLEVYFSSDLENLGSSAFWGSTTGLTIYYEGSENEWAKIELNGNLNLNDIRYNHKKTESENQE